MMGLRSHSKLMAKVDPKVISFECFIILWISPLNSQWGHTVSEYLSFYPIPWCWKNVHISVLIFCLDGEVQGAKLLLKVIMIPAVKPIEDIFCLGGINWELWQDWRVPPFPSQTPSINYNKWQEWRQVYRTADMLMKLLGGRENWRS